MKEWINRLGYALIFCAVQLALVKFGQFAFGGLMVIFGIMGTLTLLMGHKTLGWGAVIGTVLFAIVLLVFGWAFMEGWVSPEEYFRAKNGGQ